MTQHGLDHHDLALCWTYGTQSREFHAGKRWEDVEGLLRDGWLRVRGLSRLEWDAALPHVRAAWEA